MTRVYALVNQKGGVGENDHGHQPWRVFGRLW